MTKLLIGEGLTAFALQVGADLIDCVTIHKFCNFTLCISRAYLREGFTLTILPIDYFPTMTIGLLVVVFRRLLCRMLSG